MQKTDHKDPDRELAYFRYALIVLFCHRYTS